MLPATLSTAAFSFAHNDVQPSLLVQPATTGASWADHGSGAALDVTVFKTSVPSGWSAVSDYAQEGYGTAGTFTNWQRPYGPPIAIKQAGDGALLSKPTGWSKIYTADASSPFTLWRATPPKGFVAIGDVGTTDGKPPPADAPYVVISEQCVASCDADTLLW